MARPTTVLTAFMLGTATGAAAMYLSDPDRGRSRRSELSDRAGATARQMSDDVGATARQAKDQAAGAVREAGRPAYDSGPADDRALADRIRSEVMDDHRFSGLNVAVVDGEATLRGVLEPEDARKDLVDAVGSVQGVGRVIDLTHASGTPAPTLEDARQG